MDSVTFLLDSLTSRKQRTKIGTSYRDLAELFQGKLQGSILGPIFFNLFINIFFLVEKSEVFNFADKNALYSFGNLLRVKQDLIYDMKIY